MSSHKVILDGLKCRKNQSINQSMIKGRLDLFKDERELNKIKSLRSPVLEDRKCGHKVSHKTNK